MLKLKRLKLLNPISAKFLPNFSIEKGLTACTLVLIYNFVFCEIFYVFYALCWKINKDAFSKDLVILTNIRFFCWDQQNYHENLKNNEFLPITPFWKYLYYKVSGQLKIDTINSKILQKTVFLVYICLERSW